jgi:hypothetical protein
VGAQQPASRSGRRANWTRPSRGSSRAEVKPDFADAHGKIGQWHRRQRRRC